MLALRGARTVGWREGALMRSKRRRRRGAAAAAETKRRARVRAPGACIPPRRSGMEGARVGRKARWAGRADCGGNTGRREREAMGAWAAARGKG